MLYRTVLLLLPALTLATISINMKTTGAGDRGNVEYLGSDIDIITDRERNTWQIAEEQLKAVVKKHTGSWPDDVFVKSPTPWNDLYKRFGWDQVQRTLKPWSARILGLRTQPVIVTSQEFVNNSTVKATYNAGITQQVEDTISHSWSKGGQLEMKQEIKYEIKLAVGTFGGTTSMAYTSSWGEQTEKSHKVTLGSASGVTIELAPKQSVIATLSATRGTMEVQVDYIATLYGDVACNWEHYHNGHHFWAFDVNACLQSAGLPWWVDSTEVITIGYYSDAKVEVRDRKYRK